MVFMYSLLPCVCTIAAVLLLLDQHFLSKRLYLKDIITENSPCVLFLCLFSSVAAHSLSCKV